MKLGLGTSAAVVGAMLLVGGARASAQTTHTVELDGFNFLPPNVTIAMGDTVHWVWVSGFHSVESGVGGAFDGNFRSGDPTGIAGTTFDVTFDEAFLDANARPGDVYSYYCLVHFGIGMVGSITVERGATNTVELDGFNFLPPDITIDVGDTVQWVWVSGFHNVESGVAGVFDGNFRSGKPTGTVGTTFELTFDQAFVEAHPMPAETYPYYCVVHFGIGMMGAVTVNVPGEANLADYAALVNCMGGPGAPRPHSCEVADFDAADRDGDGDVDIKDAAELMNAFSG